MDTGINYLAIVTAAVVMFVIGALWYSPALFWNKWRSLLNVTPEEIRSSSTVKIYGLTFVAFVIGAFVLAQLLVLAQANTLLEGLRTSFWIWLGFIATTMLINTLLHRKSLTLWAIEAGYQLVAFLVGGTILTLWR